MYEVVDNAIDEAMAGFADKIVVTIHADGCVSRSSTTAAASRSKPIPEARIAVPRSRSSLTVLHAGGKFGGERLQASPAASTASACRS